MTREQQKIWEQEKYRVRRITDGVGMPVDRQIVETVAILRLLGIHTHMSCGGHTARCIGPWVSFRSPRAASYQAQAYEAEKEGDHERARRAWRLVERYNAQQLHRLVQLLARFYEGRDVPHEQRLVAHGFGRLRYDLSCQSRDLLRVTPRDQRRGLLDQQRQEFRVFTEYLKAEFFGS
jgi:hypothetical protein